MPWIYLSPHLDDIALSCGGLVWEQTQAGQPVEIWTICAGDPPPEAASPFAESLHERWQTGESAAAARRREDREACARLGAAARHFSLPDCIYRTVDGVPLYASEEALFGPVHPLEAGLEAQLSADLESALQALQALYPATSGETIQLVCPLTLGGHVDHRLVRRAAERLPYPRRLTSPLWYYPDYPYALNQPEALDELRRAGCRETVFPVSEAGLRAWVDSVAAHASQISTFWPDLAAMEAAIREYAARLGGVSLWQAPPSV